MFISKSKKSSFYQLTYEVNGKRTTISTKTNNLQEAYRFLEAFQLTKKQPKEETKLFLLSEFKNVYIEFVRLTKSKKYLVSIESSFKQFVSSCGDIPLKDISIRVVDIFINSTFHRTQRGAHHYYRTLKAAFNKAVEWEHISTNPFIKIKFPKLPKAFPVFISEDELHIILANTPHQHLKDIFTVGFYTGLRLGELINMRWNWVNFFQNHITVKCTDQFLTKNKKERIVPMNEKVSSILLRRFNSYSHQQNEIAFYKTKYKILYQEYISKLFKRIVRKSNLNEKIHFHTLRHSFASLLAQKGVSLYIIKELLGHEDLATTQIYSHLQQQNLKDAVNLL
ncbi:MAG: tyrosine-type recombinase/integrase [Melioribacteraceae bacterium]